MRSPGRGRRKNLRRTSTWKQNAFSKQRRQSVTRRCPASGPPVGALCTGGRRLIAEMRAACWRKRRQYMRARRKRVRDEAKEEELYAIYREASNLLKRAIKEAQARSWDSFLDTLNRDPWSRPYRLVLGKIRPRDPPFTESFGAEDLERILTVLFSGSGEGCARAMGALQGQFRVVESSKRIAKQHRAFPLPKISLNTRTTDD